MIFLVGKAGVKGGGLQLISGYARVVATEERGKDATTASPRREERLEEIPRVVCA